MPPEFAWAASTSPEHLNKWITPAPWSTADCDIDLRPGGIFRIAIRSLQGDEVPVAGCYLEIVPNRKLVWTSALGPGYRPTSKPFGDFLFTAVISIEPHGTGTKYTATAMHAVPEDRDKHEAMGFQDGWGAALDQLVALYKTV